MSGEACVFNSPVRDFETIRIAAGDARSAGDVFAHQDALVIAVDDAADTEEVVGVTKVEKVTMPKAAVTVVAGQDAYFTDGSPGSVSNVAGGRKCGHFNTAAAVGAATAEVNFNGYGS
jgi:hypothetical protein